MAREVTLGGPVVSVGGVWRVLLRSAWAHRRRLGSTVLAVVLGVGFMSGTFILSTTLDEASRGRFGNVSADLEFFQALLQVFGVVALLVGAFVIANTFSILVSQRTRELALLRALGASRTQVFGSVLGEAVLLGVGGSVLGLLLGAQLARWLDSGMHQLGLDLPDGDLVIRLDTVLVSFLVGVGVTALAALVPALRATRVLPVAALRDVEAEPTAVGWGRVAGALAAIVLGGWGCAPAWRSHADVGLPRTGLGALLLVAGLIALGPALVGRTLRWPRALLARWPGLTGRLACDNAARSPRRTSTTAGAVLITTALVVFVAAFAGSAVQSVRSDAERGFVGDFIVTGPGGLTLPNGLLVSTMPATVVDAVREVPGVRRAVGMGYERARLTFPDGTTSRPFVSSIDADGLGTLLLPRMADGEVAGLGDDEIVIDRVDAARRHVGIGDVVGYQVGDGRPIRLRVAALSDDPNLLGHATVTRARYLAQALWPRDVQVGGSFAAGADPDVVLGAIRTAIAGTPDAWVVTREAFVEDLTGQIRSFVNVLYALLVLSVLISIVGVANTLSLTIHERTRELGLLRVLGMDRAQVRSAIRMEALVLGALGTGLGLVVGALLSLALVRSLRDLGLVAFALPAGAVLAIGTAAVCLTVVASIRPAVRASSVSVLDAVAAP